MKIIVDAMGGDYAPQVVIDGAVLAVKDYDVDVVLVGDQAKIKPLLEKKKYDLKNSQKYADRRYCSGPHRQ